MAGQLGLDEGGILQAVSRPVGKQTVTTYEYNRKGLVTEEKVTEISVSVADVMTVLVAALAFYYGPAIADAAESASKDYKEGALPLSAPWWLAKARQIAAGEKPMPWD